MVNPYNITSTSMPGPVKAARVLMFVIAGSMALTAISAYTQLAEPAGTAYALGAALGVFGLFGAVSLVLGLRMDKGRKPLWWGIIALQVAGILFQLSRLADGDPFALIALGFPIAILILVCRKPSRAYFSRSAQGSGNQYLG